MHYEQEKTNESDIDCRFVHGDNSFCHCYFGFRGKRAPPRMNTPIDPHWSSVEGHTEVEFVNRILNTNNPQAKFILGKVKDSRTVSASHFGGGLERGVMARIPQPTTVRAQFWLVSTKPLTALNVTGGSDGEKDIWTENGWVSLDDALFVSALMRKAMSFRGKYYYRIRLDEDGITGFAAASDEDFDLSFFRIGILQRAQKMNVAANSPALHIASFKNMTMDGMGFPEGVRLKVKDPQGNMITGDRTTDTVLVKSFRRSLWHCIFINPLVGEWEITVSAPEGTPLCCLFQATPSKDVHGSISRALSQIYTPDDWMVANFVESYGCGASSSCIYCYIGLFAIEAILIVGVAVYCAPLTTAILSFLGVAAAVVVPLFGLVAIQGLGILNRYLCSLIGACELTRDEEKLKLKIINQEIKYDQYCYLTTHNAFSYFPSAKFHTQQSYNIAEQLEKGVDAFMFDTYIYQPPNGERDVYLCHENCGKWIGTPFPRRLAEELVPIVTELAREESRILTIIFESRTHGEQELLKRAFVTSGAWKYLFFADREEQPNGKKWNVKTNGWPTKRWMIDSGLRLVVFSDKESEFFCEKPDQSGPCRRIQNPPGEDGLPYLWDFAVENVYGGASLDSGKTEPRKGSASFSRRKRRENKFSLFVLNRFPDGYITGFVPHLFMPKINSYEEIEEQVRRYTDAANGPPNFLAVDYFHLGSVGPGSVRGGPIKATQLINGLWREQIINDD